ncbi:MAG: hypothetical protein EOO16_07460 [Chitinophagaceae bacterium]|nr:MAG: hypothetical protein EOO16_07460 [Chitinophagaceae bacterium]
MKKVLFAAAILVTTASCSLTKPVSASSNPIGSKVGKASGTCFLGALCFGADASIQTAAKNGGITKVSTVDLQTNNILGIVITYTCIVTGE